MVIQPVLGLGEKGEKKSHILASGSAAPWGWPQHQASVRTSISDKVRYGTCAHDCVRDVAPNPSYQRWDR